MVFLYVPNIVGYVRASLIVCASEAMVRSFKTKDLDLRGLFMVLYVINFILDAVDGFLARALNQTSRFGAALDMILDRLGSALLFIALTLQHESSVWLNLLFLDIASHWFLTLATKEHKVHTDLILKWYYSNLLAVCVFHEAFLITLLSPLAKNMQTILLIVFFPGFVAKIIVNVAQLIKASKDLAKPQFDKIY